MLIKTACFSICNTLFIAPLLLFMSVGLNKVFVIRVVSFGGDISLVSHSRSDFFIAKYGYR